MSKYKVSFHGIDGDSSVIFSRLDEAAEYVRNRDLGEEYRRSWGLQGEFGMYSFEGFSWADIRPNGEYLPLDSVRVTFRKSTYGLKAWVCGEEKAFVFQMKGDTDWTVNYRYDLAGEKARYERFGTLEEAKASVKTAVKEWATRSNP